MARTSTVRTSAPSRVRFIMLDAELNEGDLSQFTQAIQNALRPATPIAGTPRVIAQKMALNDEGPQDSVSAEPVIHEPIPQAAGPSFPSRPVGARRQRVPKVLGIDLTSGISFESFAQAKSPPNDMMRYLVIAAWFKQHRETESITADHIYTCYRAVNWPSAINDFSAPLRSLKRSQLLVQTGRGAYALNHLGLAKIDKLGG